MFHRFLFLLFCLVGEFVLVGPLAAQQLGFRPAAEKDFYAFDTGSLRGQVRMNGKNQGFFDVVHKETQVQVANTDYGLLCPYRIFSRNQRYGDAARNWPTRSKILADGALEVNWPAAEGHPLEIQAVYRWTAADTLDLQIQATPQKEMPQFEIFLGSYFAPQFRAFCYVKPNLFNRRGKPRILAADVNPLVDGSYLAFPRDREAVRTIFDGRWDFGPSPVQWSITHWLAGPLGVRKDEQSGVATLIMAPPKDCFAVLMPYNKTPADGVAGHASLYLSLFGGDAAAGQTVKARCRMAIAKGLSDEQMIERYRAYVE
jgi:hypothetical protein